MKVAVVHYWFVTRRGGEKVVESILKLFPHADVYTLFYDKEQYGNHLEGHQVYTSVLNKSFLRKIYQKIFPLYPIGIKSLKLKGNYDLIISSESGPAKGILNKNETPHLCYIHSPMRYCWGFTNEYLESVNPLLRPIVKLLFERLRRWDEKTINNVDLYIANSRNVANRVRNFYKRDSKVIYPPINNELFEKVLEDGVGEKTYISFGALTPYKRIDLLVDVFNENGKRLIVIGEGSEAKKLRSKAKSNIEFKGALKWGEIEDILSRARALLFPGEEDFGMIPLEVMAYGVPVIAFGKGGGLETVVENTSKIEESSGIFFNEQTVSSLELAISKFEKIENKFNKKWIREHASKFRESVFLERMEVEINEFLKSKK